MESLELVNCTEIDWTPWKYVETGYCVGQLGYDDFSTEGPLTRGKGLLERWSTKVCRLLEWHRSRGYTARTYEPAACFSCTLPRLHGLRLPFSFPFPGQTALSFLFFNFYLTPLDSSMLLFWSYWLLEGCRFIAWRTAKGSRKPMLVDNGTGRVILFNVFHVSNASASLKASSFPGLRVLLHRFVVCSVFLPVGGRQAGPHFCGHNPTLSKGSAECSIKKDTTFLSGEMPRIHSLAFGFPVSPPTNETTDTSEWEYTDLVRKSIQ